jgi:hypothetical protein
VAHDEFVKNIFHYMEEENKEFLTCGGKSLSKASLWGPSSTAMQDQKMRSIPSLAMAMPRQLVGIFLSDSSVVSLIPFNITVGLLCVLYNVVTTKHPTVLFEYLSKLSDVLNHRGIQVSLMRCCSTPPL